jgi:hypothetical protein
MIEKSPLAAEETTSGFRFSSFEFPVSVVRPWADRAMSPCANDT